MNDTLTTAEALLGDLAGFESFRNEGRGLGEELREYQREQVDQWSRQTLAAIDHPSEPLRYLMSVPADQHTMCMDICIHSLLVFPCTHTHIHTYTHTHIHAYTYIRTCTAFRPVGV